MTHNIITFLRKLSENNYKEWFDSHRNEFEARRNELISITDLIIKGVSRFDPSIAHLEAKKCLFRQHRDIRFSKNKQPYKTTMSAYLAQGGKKSSNAGYYIHFEPDKSFIGGGIYSPDTYILKAIRSEIYFNFSQWEDLINNDAFKMKFGSLVSEDKLQRPPKGFPIGFPGIDYLKNKHFIVSRNFDPEKMSINEIVEMAVEDFRIMHPLNEFLNNAVLNAEG